MKLDLAASRTAIASQLGDALGLGVEAVAWGIHDIVNESMTAAIRAHGAEKGVDLRRFGLIAFGGAGPIHAYAIARRLKLTRVVCPFGAGVASAIGCLVAVPAVDMVAAHPCAFANLAWAQVADRFAAMRTSAAGVIGSLVGAGAVVTLAPQFEMRCAGQGYAVVVALPADTPINAALGTQIEAGFRREYEQVYGHQPPKVALEVVNLRARIAHVREVKAIRVAGAGVSTGAANPVKGQRQVYFEAAGGYVATPVLDRYLLQRGEKRTGPAIIEERETTIVIGPDARFEVDQGGNVIIELEGEAPDV